MIPKMDKIPGVRYGLVIGCGAEYREPTKEMIWVNHDGDPAVHADLRTPIGLLHERYRGFFDEIEAKDVLEHVPYNEEDKTTWETTLRSWIWCLAPGGQIMVQVPDLCAIATLLSEEAIDEATANRVIFGESTTQWDRHYQAFTQQRLIKTMNDLGIHCSRAETIHVCTRVTGSRR